VTSLIPALSCRSCRPNAPFAELVQLSRTSIADETRIEHTSNRRTRAAGSGGRRNGRNPLGCDVNHCRAYGAMRAFCREREAMH
jgi:hypothetical protein